MSVYINNDKNLVENIREKIKSNDGYCPCKIYKNEDTKCMCKEFREQIKDNKFEGTCHCGLYVKVR